MVCSYLEVYNDQIFDLLSEEPQGGARRPVRASVEAASLYMTSQCPPSPCHVALRVVAYPLSDTRPTHNDRQALKPADRGGRIEVKGLSKHHITDVQQGPFVCTHGCLPAVLILPFPPPYLNEMTGLALVRQGAQNRRNAATKLNLDSSRSHSVFTIELVGKDGGAAVGTLWIVDLAGSERSHRAGSWQDRWVA